MDESKDKCFLCGATENLTRDHIPPSGFFKPPLPTDLITVSACAQCNSSYSLDEEYFRAFAATQGYQNSIGHWIWKNKVVGSSFRRSPALKTAIASRIISLDVHTPSGLYLGKQGAVLYQADRVNRVLEKIVRGLFQHHHPEIDLAGVSFDVNMTVIDNELAGLLVQLKRQSIGADTFTYWRGLLEHEQRQSFWFLLFYDRTMFTVTTFPPKLEMGMP